jgi:hypothetical protein
MMSMRRATLRGGAHRTDSLGVTMMGKEIRRLSYKPLNFHDGDDLAALDEAVTTSSPRAAAIVATALLEDALRWCLCGFLIPAAADQAELPDADQAEVFENENAP